MSDQAVNYQYYIDKFAKFSSQIPKLNIRYGDDRTEQFEKLQSWAQYIADVFPVFADDEGGFRFPPRDSLDAATWNKAGILFLKIARFTTEPNTEAHRIVQRSKTATAALSSLRKRFSIIDISTLHQRMHAIDAGKFDSSVDYVAALENIFAHLKTLGTEVDQELKKSVMIRGLATVNRFDHIHSTLSAHKRHLDFDALVETLHVWEVEQANKISVDEPLHAFRSTSGTSPVRPVTPTGLTGTPTGTAYYNYRQRTMEKVECCLNCGGPFHNASVCPVDPELLANFCLFCKLRGHTVKTCKVKPPNWNITDPLTAGFIRSAAENIPEYRPSNTPPPATAGRVTSDDPANSPYYGEDLRLPPPRTR